MKCTRYLDKVIDGNDSLDEVMLEHIRHCKECAKQYELTNNIYSLAKDNNEVLEVNLWNRFNYALKRKRLFVNLKRVLIGLSMCAIVFVSIKINSDNNNNRYQSASNDIDVLEMYYAIANNE